MLVKFTCFKISIVGSSYENHVSQMAPAVQDLAQMESKAQLFYLRKRYSKGFAETICS